MTHFADRLCEAIRKKGNPLCVGLDPRWESLPDEIRNNHESESIRSVSQAFGEFSLHVLDIVAPLVPVVKPQSAFFEMLGPPGMMVLQVVLERARELGLITILDNKRGDIASTAAAYAEAAIGRVTFDQTQHAIWDADAVTINPYLGRDAVEPFLQTARRNGTGVFVLVRTSNPGAGLFQDLEAKTTGSTDAARPLFELVGEAVRGWSQENLGACGYGDVGAVVGATYPAELARLRAMLPEVFFLVPGFGSQGGSAADVQPALKADRLGAVINSSRGILFPRPPSTPDWQKQVEQATRDAIRALTTPVS
jgi:orotidine-5'-phosphate decarboxylase